MPDLFGYVDLYDRHPFRRTRRGAGHGLTPRQKRHPVAFDMLSAHHDVERFSRMFEMILQREGLGGPIFGMVLLVPGLFRDLAEIRQGIAGQPGPVFINPGFPGQDVPFNRGSPCRAQDQVNFRPLGRKHCLGRAAGGNILDIANIANDVAIAALNSARNGTHKTNTGVRSANTELFVKNFFAIHSLGPTAKNPL